MVKRHQEAKEEGKNEEQEDEEVLWCMANLATETEKNNGSDCAETGVGGVWVLLKHSWSTYNPETGEMLVDNRVCRRRMAFIWFNVSPWVGFAALLSKLSLLLSISAAVAATFRLVDTPTLLPAVVIAVIAVVVVVVVIFLFSSRCGKSRVEIDATTLVVPFVSLSFMVSTFCEIFWTRSRSFVVCPFAFSTLMKRIPNWLCARKRNAKIECEAIVFRFIMRIKLPLVVFVMVLVVWRPLPFVDFSSRCLIL